MKEKEGYADFPEQQIILYVEKEDGKYGPIQTGSYLSANYIDDYFDKRRNLESALREQVISGKKSMIFYYMILEDLSLSELSSRVKINKSRVKKHLDANQFGKATAEELRRYANVFNIPVANLLQVILIRENDLYKTATEIDNKIKDNSLIQQVTNNPFVTETKIKECK